MTDVSIVGVPDPSASEQRPSQEPHERMDTGNSMPGESEDVARAWGRRLPQVLREDAWARPP